MTTGTSQSGVASLAAAPVIIGRKLAGKKGIFPKTKRSSLGAFSRIVTIIATIIIIVGCINAGNEFEEEKKIPKNPKLAPAAVVPRVSKLV